LPKIKKTKSIIKSKSGSDTDEIPEEEIKKETQRIKGGSNHVKKSTPPKSTPPKSKPGSDTDEMPESEVFSKIKKTKSSIIKSKSGSDTDEMKEEDNKSKLPTKISPKTTKIVLSNSDTDEMLEHEIQSKITTKTNHNGKSQNSDTDEMPEKDIKKNLKKLLGDKGGSDTEGEQSSNDMKETEQMAIKGRMGDHLFWIWKMKIIFLSKGVVDKLPDFLHGHCFWVYESINPVLKRKLVRFINAFGGSSVDFFFDDVTDVVAEAGGDQKLQQEVKSRKGVKIIEPDWLLNQSNIATLKTNI